jgi:hypothetical protein
MQQDIKNSVIVNIEHLGLGIAYEIQFLEDDTYETFYVDYHALANHFDENFNTDLIANLSDSTIIDMIDEDIEYEEMDFYRLIDGLIVSIDHPVKDVKNDEMTFYYFDYVRRNKFSYAYYIQRCADEDRNFFRWLFDDESIEDHGKNLPSKYQELYNEYLWDNMTMDSRIDSILTVIKDSDDAEYYMECNYSGTPDHMSIIINK